MKKQISLSIQGDGSIITQHKISLEQKKKLQSIATLMSQANQTPISIERVLENNLNRLTEFGFTNDNWFDCDSVCSYSGPSLESQLVIKELGEDSNKTDQQYDLSNKKLINKTHEFEDDTAYANVDDILSFVSMDRGEWKSTVFEIDKEQVFDIKLFSFKYMTVVFPDGLTRELITDWYYNGFCLNNIYDDFGEITNIGVLMKLHQGMN